jgi:hypothetical protein
MFKDEYRRNVWDEIRQHSIRPFNGRLTPELFREAAKVAGLALGSGPLWLGNLVWLGVASAIHLSRNFADILLITMKLLEDQEGFSSHPLRKEKERARRRTGHKKRSKHDPRRNDPTEVSEEAFAKARKLMPMSFWTALLMLLAQKFEQEHESLLRWNGFRLLAIDGTSVTLPDWKKLKEHYGTAKNGRRRGKTQARMVMLQSPLTRIPLGYEVSPLSVGEITLAERLIVQLRRDDLLLMDRGFFSYGLFCRIQQRGAFFGVRLRRGVKFTTLRRLGSKKDRLVRWTPKDSRGKWKSQGLPPSMELRVIDYQIRGFRPSAIVTNVTDPQRISRDDWVRLTTDSEPGRTLDPGLYHRRWEIETTFMELKVRQGMEGGLRSRTPESLEYEIAGHVLLYLLVRWMIVEAAVTHGHDPLRLSFVHALRELDDMRPALLTASPQWAARVLLSRLLKRIAQHQVPLRPGRHDPRPNDTKPKNKGRGQIQPSAKLSRRKG